MRISDWSSDVCSSDLLLADRARAAHRTASAQIGPQRRKARAPVDAVVLPESTILGFDERRAQRLRNFRQRHLPMQVPATVIGYLQRPAVTVEHIDLRRDRKSTRLNSSH